MKPGRRVLFAILVYVTLDLSLPAMPGAFVFEPAASVESAQLQRGRAATEVVLLPAPLPGSPLLAPPRTDHVDVAGPAPNTGPAPGSVVSRLPRASLAPAPASEDPQ